MTDSRRFERNLGFLSTQEQEILENSTIAIAGAGGDGGALALSMARMGVGEIRLADPDPFEIENINRQATCVDSSIGKNKAQTVADYITDINPDARTVVFTDGITQENVKEFVSGSDLVIDETEFTMHALGIMLAREARSEDTPVLTALNIGFGAMVTTFKPGGKTIEEILGFENDEPLDEIAEKEVPLSKWLPYLPGYIDLKVFEKVANGEKSAPSISPGVNLAASIGSTQSFLNLVGDSNNRPKPVYAPRALIIDPMTGDMKKVRYNLMTHYRHLGAVIFNNVVKRNPVASY